MVSSSLLTVTRNDWTNEMSGLSRTALLVSVQIRAGGKAGGSHAYSILNIDLDEQQHEVQKQCRPYFSRYFLSSLLRNGCGPEGMYCA